MAKAGHKDADQPEDDEPTTVVASIEDDVAEARLRVEQAGVETHGLDDAEVARMDLEIQEADRARVVNDLIRSHTPRTIIGAPTPEELDDANKNDVLQEIGRREYAAANLGKEGTQLTPQELVDFERQEGGPDAVIEAVLGKPISSLSTLEQMQARSALRNQAFRARQSGGTEGDGSGPSGEPGGGADGGGSGSPGASGKPSGSGTDTGTTDDGAKPGHTPAEPAPSNDDADADSTEPVELTTQLIDNGTLSSSDPALNGQNVDLYEGSDGNFYVVTDDGVAHPFDDDGSSVKGGTEVAPNTKMEGDPDGVDSSGPPTEGEIIFRKDLDAFFHRGEGSDDGATDPSPIDEARGPVVGPATDLRQTGLDMFGQPGDRDDSFGTGSTEGTWNSDAGAIDNGPDGEAPAGPQRDDDRHEGSPTIEPLGPSDADAETDTDGAASTLPPSGIAGPVDSADELPDEILGPA